MRIPVYTFVVNNIDWPYIFSQSQPDGNIENIILQLKNAEVRIPFVKKPLKYGDTFTLHGSKAIRVYEMFIGKTPKVLELVV
jgi:hypothetical protein